MLINVNPRGGFVPPTDLPCEGWRFVFDRWDGQRVQSIDETLDYYQPIVSQLAQQGRTIVLVLNQQSWGDGGVTPWAGGQAWEAYALEFASMASRVALRWGASVRYQIGNEHDIRGESSIYWTSQQYGLVLRAAIEAIRGVDQSAIVYSHGHASAAEDVVRYWREVEQVLGDARVDAVALHPYGQYLRAVPPISTGWFGDLRDYWRVVERIGRPLVVTEIGVSEPSGFAPREWPAIASYMREVESFLRERAQLTVWFAWHDGMRGAGIVDGSGQPKQPIYQTFVDLNSVGDSWLVTVPLANVRELPTISSPVIAQARRGERLTRADAAQQHWDALAAELAYPERWLTVRVFNRVGFIRGDLVQ